MPTRLISDQRCQALTVAFVLFAVATACPAESISFSFNVPKAPAKAKPGGWGFFVITFDREITGGTFTFLPECGTPADGTLLEDNTNPNDKKTIAFGPGNYGLGQTGQPDGSLGPYGTLNITINYPAPAAPPPKIVFQQAGTPVSFWQYKTGGFGFNTETNPDNRQDQALSPNDIVITPAPTTVAGGIVACAMLVLGRMRRARPSVA